MIVYNEYQKKLSDRTLVGSKDWKFLKEDAMGLKFKQSHWFQQLDEEETSLILRLRTAQIMQGNMEPLQAQEIALFQKVPPILMSFLYFLAGILMQQVVNREIQNGMDIIKYSLNHYWKFKFRYLAFFAGFL